MKLRFAFVLSVFCTLLPFFSFITPLVIDNAIAVGAVAQSTATFAVFLPIINSLADLSPAITATPNATASATPSAIPSATRTSTATRTPTATATQTLLPVATETATPTATATPPTTPLPTPTTTATSIPFPTVTFSCAAEPTINNAVKLRITVTTTEAAPAAASFYFEPTSLAGPVEDDILQPHAQLTNIFSGETSATSPGSLAKCDVANSCIATYTLTESRVTVRIGETVECKY